MADGDLTGRTLGEFILGERLGGGAQGVVYCAYQPALGRDVVIKVLRTQNQRSLVAQERFLREAKLASLLDHPYAAHVYAFDVEPDGLMWIAMERVHGITLHAWLAEHGTMPLDQLVPFIEHVAKVVHAAHQHEIVHRDLKPSNVMVIERDGSMFPKLLDFGVAKAPPEIAAIPRSSAASEKHEDERARHERQIPNAPRDERITATNSSLPAANHLGPLTRPGSGLGSSAYMAPEQWRDAWTVGPGTDIYALGVIVYRALIGEEPFTGPDAGEYYRQHREASPPRLVGELAPVDRVVQRALAKSPGDRHASALDFSADLRAALRASEREQLRTAAQQWDDRRRSPGLLWGREELPNLERWARREPGVLSPLECSFVAASQGRARRAVWMRRMLGLCVVAVVMGGLLYRATMRARIAESTAAQAELEQGRSALLHGEPEALAHLTVAYEHDHTPSTAFMLARAMEPRLAEQARFASTFERMWSAVFSPDGRQIATTDDLNAQLWDAQTHRLLFKLKHDDVVYHAVYDASGSRLVTACGDGAVRIWDTTTGSLLRELRQKGNPRIRVVALSPDERMVAGLGYDPDVAHVWDARTGQLLAELHVDSGTTFPSLAFSADGRWLAMSTGDDVSVLDTQTWERTHAIAERGIHSLKWDPSGPHLLTGGAKGDVSIWEVPSGERVHRLHESGEAVDAVTFASNGRLVAAGSRDGDEQVWNAASGEPVSRASLRSKILSLEFDRTGSLLVTGSSNGIVNVNDVASGMPVSVLDGPTAVVRAVHFDPSSTYVLGASWDGTARIWSAMSPYRRWASSPIADDCGLVTSLEPDRRFLAISCRDRPTKVWDTARGQLMAELPSATPAGTGLASAYPAVSVAGDRAAIARGETVEVYELPEVRLLRKIRHGSPITAVAFAADGHDIISGAADGSLVVTRDNDTRIELPISSASIDVVGFLAGNRVVEVDAQRRLRIYDIGGSRLTELKTRARVAMLRMSADGRRLVTTSVFTGKVVAPELWDIEHYRPLAQLTARGQAQVYSTRFVAGGHVLTACGDGAVRMWDEKSGQLRQTYRGGSRFIADATLSDDGAMIIGGGGGGQLRFWEASSGRPLWTMPAHHSDLVGVHVEGDDIVTRGFSGEVARWHLPPAGQVIEACAHDERCAIVPP